MKFMNKPPTSVFVGALAYKMSMTCYTGTDCSLLGDMNKDWGTEKWVDTEGMDKEKVTDIL